MKAPRDGNPPPMIDRRFPSFLYRRGSEPDPRFSLANERTFLAWIRTSLALIAVGVALEALALPLQPELRLTSAIIFVLLGILAAAQSFIGWLRTEKAMRENRVMPAPALSVILAAGVMIAAVLIIIGLVI